MTGKAVPMPDPSVIFDLDAAQRPEEEIKPPFVVKVGGKNVTFKDPAEIEWKLLASVQLPGDLIRISLSTEDRNHIRNTDIKSWLFNDLMKAYYEHYDLEEKIAAAKSQAALGL